LAKAASGAFTRSEFVFSDVACVTGAAIGGGDVTGGVLVVAASLGCAGVEAVVTGSLCGWFCVCVGAVAATDGAPSGDAFDAGIGFSDIRSSSLLISILGSWGLTTFEMNNPPPRPAATAATTVPTPAK
jgi:hypothetical protein